MDYKPVWQFWNFVQNMQFVNSMIEDDACCVHSIFDYQKAAKIS
jgi:hypothetical protein